MAIQSVAGCFRWVNKCGGHMRNAAVGDFARFEATTSSIRSFKNGECRRSSGGGVD